MKKILLITDYSNASKNALEYAKAYANITKSNIISYNPYTLHPKLKEININELAKAEKSENGTMRLTDSENLTSKLLLNINAVINEILTIQKSENINLVIIGVNDVEFANESLFKNIGPNLMKETILPLLVIPHRAKYNKIKSIVFAVDFILENEIEMHKTIKDFLTHINPKIFVLNVVKENSKIMNDRIISEKNIEKYFENEIHIYSFIENNDLIKGLNDFISCNHIDMIAMLPHEHNFLQNIFFESKSKKMAFNTSIPLIVFPSNN